MKNSIKISVCIPVYGVEKYIERCARSLFEQTLLEDVEFIFVNDCTPDNSINILRSILTEYPHRISQTHIIEHAVNKGLSAARNSAVEAAKGKYVYHIDSDDFIEPQTLEALLQTAEMQNADIVANELIWYWSDRKKTVLPKKFKNRMDFIYKLLTRKVQCGIVGNLIKRELYDSIDISVPILNMGEDYVTIPQLAYYADNIVLHPEPLYNYYKNNDTAMSRMPSLGKIQEMIAGHKYLVDFFQKQREHEDFTSCFREMYIENFAIIFEYAVTDLEHLKYLRKNFHCRTLLLGTSRSVKVKIANVFFQTGWLSMIVAVTKVLQFLRKVSCAS